METKTQTDASIRCLKSTTISLHVGSLKLNFLGIIELAIELVKLRRNFHFKTYEL